MSPSPPAEARIWGTYLFHETEVMYVFSCGEVGFKMVGELTSLATSKISKDVEPNAKKLFLREFHSAHIIGYPSYSPYSAYKNEFCSSIWAS